MPKLHVYGIDHSRAPIEVREQLAFSDPELQEILPALTTAAGIGEDGVQEALLLSTCNRTEIYLVIKGDPAGYPLEPLSRYRPEANVMDDVCLRYHLRGAAATEHLYAVASSLRSQVPGDTQISTQLATAAQSARTAGTLGLLLEHAVSGALRCAKRVRRETGLMAGGAGTGPAVLQNLRRFGPPGSRRGRPVRVLLLGAGAMAEEVATHLVRSKTTSVFRRRPGAPVTGAAAGIEIAGVWARDRQKSQRFAEMFGIASVTSREAARLLDSVDAVVGACRGRVALLEERQLSPVIAARKEPLLVIDLGVPRNLDPALAGRDGLQAVFLDQLQEQMRERNRQRGDALRRAEEIVVDEGVRLREWLEQLELRPMRAEMYTQLENVLRKWRGTQPGAVRHLRVALHRSLANAFGSVNSKSDFRTSING